MVIIQPWPPTTPWPNYEPLPNWPYEPIPNQYPLEWTHKKQTISEKHIKEVKKGIMIKFDDDTWMFMATDDDCYVKVSEALNDKN